MFKIYINRYQVLAPVVECLRYAIIFEVEFVVLGAGIAYVCMYV
jgi:hypothetical protein